MGRGSGLEVAEGSGSEVAEVDRGSGLEVADVG